MSSEPTRERTERHAVEQDGDTVIVRQAAESMAESVDFDEPAVAEIGIVATELASNVRKHADSGEIAISRISDDDSEGVRIESFDVGPGIANVDAAFADGTSTAGSLGGGLGAVNRLMHQLTVAAPGEPDFGTKIVADRWLRRDRESSTTCPLSFGAASRPAADETVNGDSFVIRRWDEQALVGVIDGLGHGADAHEASRAATEYVESHYDNSVASIFEGTERACRGTRGVVMALARFDWSADTVTVGAVGNINHKTNSGSDLTVIPRRGVVGSNGPDPKVTQSDWRPGDQLVLFSDGIDSHWNLSKERTAKGESATETARRLLDEYSKPHDDATVLVVSERVDES
jgi:anti-sigma regulatory factor (Ser/Thr protein kinase)